MPWGKIDDNFFSHPKVLAAGTLACGLMIKAISYSSHYLTDGFIAREAISSLISDTDDPISIAERLVKVRLFERVEGGYQIHDYLEYNPSKEEVERERGLTRKRQADYRSNHSLDDNHRFTQSEVTPLVTRDNKSCNAVPDPDPDPMPSPKDKYLYTGGGEQSERPDYIVKGRHAFENAIGLITDAAQSEIMDGLMDSLHALGADDWWQTAIAISIEQKKRSWGYIRGILDKHIDSGIAPMAKTSTDRASPKPKTQTFKVIDPTTGVVSEREARI